RPRRRRTHCQDDAGPCRAAGSTGRTAVARHRASRRDPPGALMIKVGFLSAVRHAQSYLPLFAADPRTQVIGVAEEPEAADWIQQDSRAFATRHELPMLTVDELIEAADLVVVCSEPTRHAALAERALAGGIDVLLDK